MPPRPTSRCYQALQSPTNASAEAVWVTDDVLGRAFQRYIDVSKVHRRTVSYAPGPMYHRKRFGRRQMTELNSFQSVGSLPVWALPNAPDLMQWQWQPPKQDLWSPWPSPAPSPSPSPSLSSSPPPAPMPAPSIAALAPLPEPEAALQPPREPQPPDHVIAGEQQTSNGWQALHDQLRAIRRQHVASIHAYNDNCKDFLIRFQCAISEGEISGHEAADIYKTAINDAEIVARRFPALARWFQLSLMSRLASGVKSAREAGLNIVLKPSKLYMSHLTRHEANVHSAELLAFAMGNMRLGNIKHYGIVFKTLNRFFDLWRGTELHGVPQDCDWSEVAKSSELAGIWSGRMGRVCRNIEALSAYGQVRRDSRSLNLGKRRFARLQEASRQLAVAKRCFARVQRFTLKSAHLMSSDSTIAEKMASALKEYDPRRFRILFVKATSLVGGESTTWSRGRYNWLQVMARLPKIRTSQFKRLMHLFARRGHAALSQTEICNLLLLHFQTIGKIEPGEAAHRIWKEGRGSKDCHALAALALAINKTSSKKNCQGAFWELWDILAVRGGRRTFLRQLHSLARSEKLSDGFLQRLAWTSDDHRIAMYLHALSRAQGHKAIWWPAFWEKYAAMLRSRWKYPSLDPVPLITKMLTPDAQAAPFHDSTTFDEGDLDKTRRKIFQKQVDRLKFGLKLLAHARHVTDRQALRVVTQFTKVLANKQGYLSSHDLADLTSVMMRTLDKGDVGSKDRFRWYLGVICRFLGEQTCLEVGLILKRRRDVNWLIWRKRLARNARLAKQTRDFTNQLLGFAGEASRQAPGQVPGHGPPFLECSLEKYMNYNKRKTEKRLAQRAPMLRSRGRLVAQCLSQWEARKARQRNATRGDDVPRGSNSSNMKSKYGLATNKKTPTFLSWQSRSDEEEVGHGASF